METLNTLVDLLKSKAKKTTDDDDLLEFEKGKYFLELLKMEINLKESLLVENLRRNIQKELALRL